VRPGSVSERSVSVHTIMPTQATVTARIVGDRERFRVEGMRSCTVFKRKMTRLEIEELPYHAREQARKALIWDEIETGLVEGEQPLTVAVKDHLYVWLRYSATNLIDGQDVYDATLEIASDSWDTVSIPVTMLVGYIETTLSNNVVSVRQGMAAPVPFTARSVAGPDTTVMYFKRDYSAKHISIPSVTLGLLRGEAVNGLFEITAKPDAYLGGEFDGEITISAFDGKQLDYIPTRVTVLPGLVTIAVVGSADLIVQQGERVSLRIRLTSTGRATVTLTPSGVLPADVFATPTTEGVSWQAPTESLFAFQAAMNAPLVSNRHIQINWDSVGGEQSGVIGCRLTVIPRPAAPTREFDPVKHGFPFKNKWSLTQEDGRAMVKRFESAIPALAALEIEAVRHALAAISLNPIPLLPSVPLPTFVINMVIGTVGKEIFKELNSRIIGAIPGENYGRCGGMAFAAYDFYLRSWRVDQFGSTPPASGDLRQFIWRRLLDSLDLNALKFMDWIAQLHILPVVSKAMTIALLSAAGSIGGPIGVAVGALIGSQVDIFDLGGETVLRDRTRGELGRLKDILNHEVAWPIGLIYGNSANPIDQHQTLAYDYVDRGDGTAVMKVWDNNDANKGRLFTIDFRGSGLSVTQTWVDGSAITGQVVKPVKGIICEEYSSVQPPASLMVL
jgi:hypothetical protein